MDPNPSISTITNYTEEQVAVHESTLVTIYSDTGDEVVQKESQPKTTVMSRCCKVLKDICGGLPSEYITTTAY